MLMNSNEVISKQTPTDDALAHAHACRAFPMLFAAQSFGKTVRRHIFCRNILNPNDVVLNRIANEVMTHVDVLGPRV